MKKILLALLIGLCSLSSHADSYDTDYITIPESYINSPGQTYLLEKAATIFNKEYRLTLTNIHLSESWFYCDIVIEKFEDDFIVTQSCDSEFPQSQAGEGTTSSIFVGKTAYDIVVQSKVRLYRDDDEKNVTVTYHFTDTWKQNDYYLVITFPYNKKTWTGINDVTLTPTSVEYYDLQGRKLNAPQPGIVIEKQGNKVTKKLYR